MTVGWKGHETAAERGIEWDSDWAGEVVAGWATLSVVWLAVDRSVGSSEEMTAASKVELGGERRDSLLVVGLLVVWRAA